MIEVGRCPARRRVADAALSRKVIGRFVGGMAGGAIGLSRVIECAAAPAGRVVAGAALSRKVTVS